MPRRIRRSARNGGIALLLLVVLAILLLLLVLNDGQVSLPYVNLPDLPNLPEITIPITGLPKIEIPSVRIPLTLQPGDFIPDVVVRGTPGPDGQILLDAQSKTEGCRLQGSLPDPGCTPGAVTGATREEVCADNFSAAPAAQADAFQERAYSAYQIASGSRSIYRMDHLVPLSLGGSNDFANLWPQPIESQPGPGEKDRLEEFLRGQVCSGAISLEEAQRRIAINWLAEYEKMD